MTRFLLGALMLCATTIANAAWPERPVTLVVPYPPGGATDTIARLIAGPLGKRLGATVVVENRAGAGTGIGATAVARSAPDGHTLLIPSNTTFTVNAALEQQLPYDPQKDFESIGLIGSSPLVLLAHPGVKAGSLKEVLERIERVTSPEPARAAGIMSARSLPELGAVTLRHPIATGEVSPVELLEACIARIGRLDPAVNAICATDHDRARAASREAEAAVTRGDPLPLLHGLPLGVKDLQATAGLLTTRGNVGLRGRVPTQDMSQVARLRRAGAIERRFADDPTLSRPRPDLDALAVPRPESKSVVTHPPLPGNGIAPMRPRSAV